MEGELEAPHAPSYLFTCRNLSVFDRAVVDWRRRSNGGRRSPSRSKHDPATCRGGVRRDGELTRSLTSIHIPFVSADSRDPRVSFYASTFAGTVFVTRDGKIVYALPASKGEEKKGWTLTEALVGGKAVPRGDGMTPTRVSSFIGNDPSRWRTDQPTYDAVALGEVWPGVDVRLRAYGRTTEKLFTVNPGAKTSRIRMQVSGARELKVTGDGTLVATTGLGDLTFSRPVAYQEIAGARREIEVAYDVRGDRYGFRLGSHDSTLPVVIDPLLQATYLGGNAGDVAFALAIHPTSGDVYVAGSTTSTNFPGTAGGAPPRIGSGQGIGSLPSDAFVARFNAELTVLHQATYLGGRQGDGAEALAIHPTSGEVYVAGFTNSSNFPGTAGGAQTTPSIGFVARLTGSLTSLTQATYLGGEGASLAINPTSGVVYVAGNAFGGLAATTGGAQATFGGGGSDGFVARLNAALTTLDQATYLGGSGRDELFARLSTLCRAKSM